MNTRTINALGFASRSSVRPARHDLAAAIAAGGSPPLLLGIGILGRALAHAWRLGDMTDDEAADFLDEIIEPLVARLARGRP